jgi:uncharacterized membrane-anchored protein YjiN (DUF445 family)
VSNAYASPLRDLIRQIDDVAHRHIAYSQAADAVRNLRDHLSAIARCEEINRELMERERESRQASTAGACGNAQQTIPENPG